MDDKAGIKYTITTTDKRQFTYKFAQQNGLLSYSRPETSTSAQWQELEYNQCPNCPLNANDHPLCPLAVAIQHPLADCSDMISFSEVDLKVEFEQRTVIANTSAQKALSSLLGLIMATSNCPRTQFFRAMAQFHLPLASSIETSFRAIATFLVMQYFKQQQESEYSFDLSDLKSIYDEMHEVNINFKKRLNSAVTEDAALNAVVSLDYFAITLPNFLEDELERLKPIFTNSFEKK